MAFLNRIQRSRRKFSALPRAVSTSVGFWYMTEALEQRMLLSGVSFQTQQTFPVGANPNSNPNSVAVSDVNSDGKPDIVTANEGSNSNNVSVLLGNGDGTFQMQQNFAASDGFSSPQSVAVSDVNGDGEPDIVTANPGSDNVSILLGNGNGTFQTQLNFVAGDGFGTPLSVAVSDVNGDGKPDLVTANGFSNDVSILLGNGNGTFQTQLLFAAGGSGGVPRSVAVSDVNDDGKLDIVTANAPYSNNVSVLLGNGNGTFQTQQLFAAGNSPGSVAVSDVNGDGKPDIVTANSGSNNVSVLLGNGNGTFQAQQNFAAGTNPQSVAMSDVNGDGKPDIVMANASAFGKVSVLLGNGNGTFQTQQTFAAGTSPQSVAVADVNGDGKPDIVAANFSSKNVSVLLNTATFSPSDLVVQNVSIRPSSITSGSTFNIGFRIQNNGLGVAVASSARQRLSVDQVLTLYDKPLSPLDVSIPAVAAGSYYDYSGTFTVPSGTPPGQYYVGVFADAFNVANQSDTTNDAGLSATKLTVTAPVGVTLPTITQQPLPLDLNQGDSGQFSVAVTGTGPFSYQWYHGTSPIVGSNTSTLSFSSASLQQAGQYSAQISNAAGTVTTNTVTLTVTAADKPIVGPGGDVLFDDQTPNPALPTIVITHGWQPTSTFTTVMNALTDQSEVKWVADMRDHIRTRLQQSGVSANILLYVWPQAFTLGDPLAQLDGLLPAEAATDDAGRFLAQQLVNELGQGYANDLQFIGHSLGSVVNAYAVDQLKRLQSGIDVEQFTILDAPMKLRLPVDLPGGLLSNAAKLVLYSSDWFHKMLPASNEPYGVDYVDNYFGVVPTTIDLAPQHFGNIVAGGMGDLIAGAAALGGSLLPDNHSEVHNYYDSTITSAATDGFDYSVILRNVPGSAYSSRPSAQTWSNPTLFQKLLITLPDTIVNATVPGWFGLLGDAVSSTLTVAGQTVSGMILSASGDGSQFAAPLDDPPIDPAVARMNLDATIPSNATAITFDYRLLQPADGRWITVYFDDAPLMTFRDANYVGSDFQHEVIPVALVAGESGVLSIAINGTALQQTQLALANFEFVDEAPPIPNGNLIQSNSQAIQIQFNESVTGVDPSKLQLSFVGPGQPPPPLHGVIDPDSGTVTWTPVGGILPDGNYTVTLPASGVSDLAGNAMTTDYTFSFFVFAGDANHDRTVDGSDVYILSQNWLTSGKTFSQGDFNYDGTVDARDLGIIATHWMQTLDAPASAPPLAPPLISPIDSGATLPSPILQPSGPPQQQQPKTVYLSDLTPTSATNGYGQYEKDKSNGEAGAHDGHIITLNGKKYDKGLGVHAGSTQIYNLKGQYTQFLADIGVDDEVGSKGSVVFQVYLDNVKVYDSKTMTGSSATKSINLNVTGKKQLKLVVTDAGNGKNFDHADWAGARLVAANSTLSTNNAPVSTSSTDPKKTVNLIDSLTI